MELSSLGADFSLAHCLVPGGQVSEGNLEASPAGISDPRADISGRIVMAQRSGKVSRRNRFWLCFFSPFGIWSAHAHTSVGSKTYHVEGTVTTF